MLNLEFAGFLVLSCHGSVPGNIAPSSMGVAMWILPAPRSGSRT